MDENDIFLLLKEGTKLALQNYEKKPDFFLNPLNYIPYVNQMKQKDIGEHNVSSICLDCSAHGSFKPEKVATRFIETLEQVFSHNPNIKKVKIKLSGFDLSANVETNKMAKSSQQTLVSLMCGILSERIGSITSLQIRISNATNCTLNDFKAIMALGVNCNSIDLSNLSCEFSDWSFSPIANDLIGAQIYKENQKNFKPLKHDRNCQPNLLQFMNMLQDSFNGTLNHSMDVLRKFRLEISTWYYTDFEVEKFFHGVPLTGIENLPKNDKIPQRIQYFHNEFKKKVELLISELMPKLTNMEIDLRNWNKKFEMSVLKAAILNTSSIRRNSLSQISRKITDNQKKVVQTAVSNVQKSMMLGKAKGMLKNVFSNKNQEVQKENGKDDNAEKEIFFDLVVVV